MGDVDEIKRLLGEEGRPPRPSSSPPHPPPYVWVCDAITYIEHLEQAQVDTLSALEKMEERDEKCPTCDGSGKVPYPWSYTDWDTEMPCPDCVGKNIWNMSDTAEDPDIKQKKCDLHKILHPDNIGCPLCDGTAIKCTCGLILFWDTANEHFKLYRDHPYQIHIPVESEKSQVEGEAHKPPKAVHFYPDYTREDEHGFPLVPPTEEPVGHLETVRPDKSTEGLMTSAEEPVRCCKCSRVMDDPEGWVEGLNNHMWCPSCLPQSLPCPDCGEPSNWYKGMSLDERLCKNPDCDVHGWTRPPAKLPPKEEVLDKPKVAPAEEPYTIAKIAEDGAVTYHDPPLAKEYPCDTGPDHHGYCTVPPLSSHPTLCQEACDMHICPAEEPVETRVLKPIPTREPRTREQQLSQDLEPENEGKWTCGNCGATRIDEEETCRLCGDMVWVRHQLEEPEKKEEK